MDCPTVDEEERGGEGGRRSSRGGTEGNPNTEGHRLSGVSGPVEVHCRSEFLPLHCSTGKPAPVLLLIG